MGSSHTAVLSGTTCSGTVLLARHTRCIFSSPKTLSTKHPKSSRYSLTFILNYLTALPQAPRHFPRSSLSYHNLFRSPLCHFLGGTRCFAPGNMEFLTRTAWRSGLRRWLQAPVRKGVGSSHTAVFSGTTCNGTVLLAQHTRCIFSALKTLSTKHPKSSRYNLTFILNNLTALPRAPRHFPRSSLSYHNLFLYSP